MAKLLRAGLATQEVKSTLAKDEVARMMELLDDDSILSEVPAHMRATGEAARVADERVLGDLSRNAVARGASWVMAGKSSLGR